MECDLKVKQVLLNKKTGFAFLLLVVTASATMGVSELIQFLYPDRPIVPDIFFSIFPEVPFFAYLSEPIMFLSIITILLHLFRKEPTQVPFFFFTLALIYLLRGPLMLLTPLGRPTGNLDSYGIFEVIELKQHGMFPSGHMMLSAIFYFFVKGKEYGKTRKILAWLAFLQGFVLLISRGHYSIDIVGGIMSAYIIDRLSLRYKAKWIIGS